MSSSIYEADAKQLSPPGYAIIPTHSALADYKEMMAFLKLRNSKLNVRVMCHPASVIIAATVKLVLPLWRRRSLFDARD